MKLVLRIAAVAVALLPLVSCGDSADPNRPREPERSAAEGQSPIERNPYLELRNSELVVRYCEYGAVSREQLLGCIDHVDEGDVYSRSTNAADYAVGALDACLADAGPFCIER